MIIAKTLNEKASVKEAFPNGAYLIATWENGTRMVKFTKAINASVTEAFRKGTNVKGIHLSFTVKNAAAYMSSLRSSSANIETALEFCIENWQEF